MKRTRNLLVLAGTALFLAASLITCVAPYTDGDGDFTGGGGINTLRLLVL